MEKHKLDKLLWVKVHPQFAKEMLGAIRFACQTGAPLDQEQRGYLIEAIQKIEAGLSADRALYLTRRAGAPRKAWDRNAVIFNRVEELRAQGVTWKGACARVATEEIAKKKHGTALTASAVDAIYTKMLKAARHPGSPKKLSKKY